MKLTRQEKIEQELSKLNKRQRKGDYAYFRLVGGPHHGMKVRLYTPFDALTYPDGSTYELHPPMGRSDDWVYIHTTSNTDQNVEK